MRKKIYLLAFLLVFSVSKSYSKDFYALGVNAYNSQNYSEAVQNFEYAVKINPKDVKARYYLAQAYINMKLISDAKEQYTRIIMLAPDSNTAYLAQKGLSLIRQSELGIGSGADGIVLNDTLPDNYLEYVLANGKIMKWAKMPISVYVQSGAYKATVVEAFKQWQTATNDVVKFTFVSNPNAQITVAFTNKLEAVAGKESYVAGYSKPYYKNGNFVKSEIRILTIDPEGGKALGNDFISFSTLHEIGHSLGFNGHSPNENDVMYASSTEPKLKLTKRDINTMKILYSIDETRLAKLNSGGDKKLQQLKDYVKQFPDKTVGWTNLADHYVGQNNYAEAIKCYKKVIALDSSSAEPYNLLGNVYAKMGNKEAAYKNLKQACDLEKHNEYYIYQFVNSCVTPEQKAVGNKYLKDFIKENPSKTNTDVIRRLLSK